MSEEIRITISPNGDVQVEGHGLMGQDCVKLTAALEQALGEVARRELKPDYRRAAVKGRTASR